MAGDAGAGRLARAGQGLWQIWPMAIAGLAFAIPVALWVLIYVPERARTESETAYRIAAAAAADMSLSVEQARGRLETALAPEPASKRAASPGPARGEGQRGCGRRELARDRWLAVFWDYGWPDPIEDDCG
jgi:hypothetical protein